MMKLPVVRPRFPDTSTIWSRFADVMATGQVTNNGTYVIEFERQLSEYIGAPTLAFSSGMAALTAMLMAADVRGKEVILPSFTFPATPQAVIQAGGIPVFAEIDRDMTLAPDDVWCRITDRTAAILGVDVYGIPSDYESLSKMADEHDIWFLMDSAPAFGSTYKGKLVGTQADAHIFSFHATKPFTTMEGGCLCSNNSLFERAMHIRNFGQGSQQMPYGINGKMMEVCALIGLEQMKTWRELSILRKSIAATLRSVMRGHKGITIISDPLTTESIWCYQPILVDADKRDEIRLALYAKGIDTRAYYPATHHAYGGRTILPVTDDVARSVIALPIYNDMSAEEIAYLADSVKTVCEEAKCRTSLCSAQAAI